MIKQGCSSDLNVSPILQFSSTSNFQMLTPTEIRYRWHKSLLKEDKVEEAIRVLESVPDDQSVPKVKYALAKLHLKMTRPAIKTTRATMPKWIKYFK